MAPAQNGIPRFRSHLIRQQPTKAELATRSPIVLTSRDHAILTAVHIHGCLTVDHIELAFFPPTSSTGRRSPSSRVHDRLRQLWLWGFLDRVELPVSRNSGRRPLLYTLGTQGIPIVEVERETGRLRVQRRRLDRLGGLGNEHDLMIASFWAQLVALLRARRGIALRWIPERELRARRIRVRDPKSGRLLPMLPDAYLELRYPSGAIQCVMLEVDMGTLTLARFRRKVRAFEVYLAQGLLAKHWGQTCFEVVVLTHSRARLANLSSAARKEVRRDRWSWYTFASFEILDPRRFDDYSWRTLEEKYVTFLYGDDAPEPDGHDEEE